jgi:hypothetical protein
VIHFYLADDTVEVRELNAGSPAAGQKLVKRQKLPKKKISSRKT